MTSGCYQTSCWCAPFRWISRCCYTPQSPTLQPITQVAVHAIANQNTHPTHHRERTWKLSNGRMTYDISHSVVRKEGGV